MVLIGQDPYISKEIHNNKIVSQAMGLSFSVPIGVKIPPSLVNIFNNLLKFKHILEYPKHGNLQAWAQQGCLLLNSSLTVKEGDSNSHANIWVEFTNKIINYISDNKENICFVLWGRNAADKSPLINGDKHNIIISSHPSPFSCGKTMGSYKAFNDVDHFGLINKYLEENKKDKIIWKI